MKILFSVMSQALSYGGPAVSVPSLANALNDRNIECAVWSNDLGIGFDEFVEGFGLPDLVHDNGIWMPHNHAIADWSKRHGVPRIVSTRGMLSPWAFRHKIWKKLPAWWLYQKADLESADLIHVTATSEAEHIRSRGLSSLVRLVPNGIDLEISERTAKEDKDPKRALFLGRVYPVKGLANFIKAWAKVEPKSWEFHIVGPDEAGHKQELIGLVKKLGLQNSVIFRDAVEGTAKTEEFQNADLFVLPSFSESFGISAVEAMATALPVIVTTGTPLAEVVDEGLGWCAEPTVDSLAEALGSAVHTTEAERVRMGNRASVWVNQKFSWQHLASQYIDMYEHVISAA